jgi:membrane fusion protein, multidrug efflux system
MGKVIPVLAKIVLPIILVGVGVGGFAYMLKTKPIEKPKAAKERVWNVAAMTVTPASRAPELTVFGTLKSARNVELRSLVAGEVIRAGDRLHEGGLVNAGDLLVEIDPFRYELAVTEKESAISEAQARLKEFSANLKSEKLLLSRDREILDLEKRNLARSEKLRKKGNISDKSLDSARTSLNRQRQQVEQRTAQLDIMEAKILQQRAVIARSGVSLELAQRDLKNTKLTAPFDGYLSNISAELGKRIDAKDRVAALTDAARLEVSFHLSSRQYGLLLESKDGVVGRPIVASWKVGSGTKIFRGQIERISSEIRSETGGVELFAVLEDGARLTDIRPGAFVEVLLVGDTYDDAIELPDHAVYGNQVYVVVDGRLEPRKISILFNNGASLIVEGDVKAGDKLVTTRFAEIGPGLRVEIR